MDAALQRRHYLDEASGRTDNAVPGAIALRLRRHNYKWRTTQLLLIQTDRL